MEFRNLGTSGLKVSEISYGNWLTHGSQVEEEQAQACVRRALDEGITTFDTADVYANTAAESVLGRALAGQRRESLEIFTKVYWPTGPGGPNDSGLSRKHIHESINASLTRLQTDYVDLYQAHRYDHETPLEETMEAFADVVRQGKALYIGVSEWTAEQIRAGHALARELKIPFVSNQPQYNMLWRVIEAEVIPASVELGMGQVVWSPIAQGVLTGKYLPGQPLPEGSRAAHEEVGSSLRDRLGDDLLTRVQRLQAGRRPGRAQPRSARRCLGARQPGRVVGDRRRLAPGAGQRERQGVGQRSCRPTCWPRSTTSSDPWSSATPSKTRSPRTRDFYGRSHSLVAQGHRAVGDVIVLEQTGLDGACLDQIAPHLAEPRLGIALGRERRRLRLELGGDSVG